MDFFIRRELVDAPRSPHGGLDYEAMAKAGVSPGDVLDFSVSVSPFEPSPKVTEAVGRAAIGRYPDSSSLELRTALSRLHDLPPDSFLVTNGLSQAIYLAAFALLDRGRRALVAGPTFGEYGVASRLAGAEVTEVRAERSEGFALPVEGLCEAIGRNAPSVVWLCSPNNPTGAVLTEEQFFRVTEACSATGGLLVVDEAYVNFASPGSSLLREAASRGLVLRSMTKDYGLTGLRLGYVAGDPRIIAALGALQPPWSVNACAQAAGAAAVEERAYYEPLWTLSRVSAPRLAARLREVGYDPLPPGANFVLFDAGFDESLRSFLWERRILVRDCSSFGLRGYVRVGVRSDGENDLLVEALREYRKRIEGETHGL